MKGKSKRSVSVENFYTFFTFADIEVLTVVTRRLPGWEEGVCERVCRGEAALHNLPLVEASGGILYITMELVITTIGLVITTMSRLILILKCAGFGKVSMPIKLR